MLQTLFYVSISFGGTGVWSQSLIPAGQALYHSNHPQPLFVSILSLLHPSKSLIHTIPEMDGPKYNEQEEPPMYQYLWKKTA
jgi:hypothetical protein